ncbi:MAG TPA: tetratricopeptide repeat protein [bacterium]|nr:tetratricopeptide repeat protein [bacterium]
MSGLSGLKYLIFFLFLVFATVPASAQDQVNDFEFYKKYGHSSKVWNDSVQQGFAAYDQQNCEQAMTHLKQAVAAQCQDALVYFKLAVCSEVAGSPYTALQYYQLAEEKLNQLEVLHRYQKDIFEAYGRALFQGKKYEEAFPYLTKAAAVGTPSFGLYYMVGFLYAKKNDFKPALEFFEKALSQDTSKAPPQLLGMIYREVAKSYLQNKVYDRAEELVGKAIALNPADGEAQQIKNQLATLRQQQSMVQMIQNVEANRHGEKPGAAPVSKPPPPAASQLPPLEGAKDPTPPLGGSTTSPPPPSQSPPAPSGGTGTPGTLQPLPPLQPIK